MGFFLLILQLSYCLANNYLKYHDKINELKFLQRDTYKL